MYELCLTIFFTFFFSTTSSKEVVTLKPECNKCSSNNEHIPELELIEFEKDYNLHSYPRPRGNESLPLEVGFQVNLRNVLEVNEVSQICTLETTIRLYWKDHRVQIASDLSNLDYVTLNPQAANLFWIPDIFVDQVYLTIFFFSSYLWTLTYPGLALI